MNRDYRWPEFDRLRREMNDAFGRWHAASRGEYPLVNVWTNEEGAVLTAELPGVDSSKIEISVLGDTLTVKGRRDEPKPQEGNTFHRRERGFGAFDRTVQLPFRIDAAQVTASYRNGVLEILVPRAAESRARRIAVSAS